LVVVGRVVKAGDVVHADCEPDWDCDPDWHCDCEPDWDWDWEPDWDWDWEGDWSCALAAPAQRRTGSAAEAAVTPIFVNMRTNNSPSGGMGLKAP